MKHKILELYSGIGGMHYAFADTNIEGEVVAAIDINVVANRMYKFNYPETNLLNRNIQSMSAETINKLSPDVLLMSPPCQPFTRNGLQNDAEDPRSDSFSHVIEVLKHLHCLQYILLENVKGFECSKMRMRFIEALKNCGFYYREFLLHPHQFGIPNSRLRYYCLARRKQFTALEDNEELLYDIPNKEEQACYEIKQIIEADLNEDIYLLNRKQLRKVALLDVCYDDSRRSCCFTKAYTHFLEGTGSIYTKCTKQELDEVFKKIVDYDTDSDEYFATVESLKLRFFTPKEISLLMAFPSALKFPSDITNKQRYRLLGNSINVHVARELILFLINSK